MKKEEAIIRNEESRMKNRKWLSLLVGASLIFILPSLFTSIHAQNGLNMPYSQFGLGIGEMPYNLPMAARMGGVAYTLSGNNFVNPFNPASYAAVEKESFVFDMGLGIQLSELRDNNGRQPDADGNLSYLNFALPVTGWWKMAAGLMPLTSMDYESVSQAQYMDSGIVKTVYDGTGGTSQVFVGSAFNIPAGKGRTLQAGFNVNYLTGRVQRAISFQFQGNDSTYYMNSRRYRDTRLNNLTFDFGLQFSQQLGERYTLGLGLVYKPYRDMKVRDKAMIYTYHASDETLVDTIFPSRGGDAEFDSRLEQSQTIGIGLTLERNNRWQMAVDATFGTWNGMRYTEDTAHSIFGNNALRYGPFSRYALGFERIGNMDATSYMGRIGWSAGVHMEQGSMYLNLDGSDTRIDEWGVGLGATLPMRKGRSLLTLSLGYSSYGSAEVLQRNTLTFGIAVSSCERWFVKRKYN